MIPKVIHYCWFGNNPMPEKEQKCIESWKKFFPDFEIKKWDESNFDYSSCTFSRQAYEKKKYAFVSDYARAKLLYEQGGLYFDTDVEIIKEFPEDIMKLFSSETTVDDVKFFMGFERRHFIGTAVMAVEKGNECIKKLLKYYEEHDFLMEDGSIDNIANVSVLTDIMREYGLELGGQKQTVAGFEIFNREYFYPKKMSEDDFRITNETCAIHKYSSSWMSEREIKRGNSKIWINFGRPIFRTTRNALVKILGKEKARKIEVKTRNKMR